MVTLNASTCVALRYFYDQNGLRILRIDCHGERRTNVLHASKTNLEAHLDTHDKG
jgi:hypothetical protein